MESTLQELVSNFRITIRDIGTNVKELKRHSCFTEPEAVNEDHGEMLANIMLAYRHLEDARMRLGKVLQAQDGGKSVYDK